MLEELHPVYQNSALVMKAAAASRFFITTSDMISNKLQSGADSFASSSKPAAKPLSFTPTTHVRVRQIHDLTAGAAGLSAKAVAQVSRVAQNLGAHLARKGNQSDGGKGVDEKGNPLPDFRPGILNKSLMAFSTVADGIEAAGKNLLTSSGTAATTVVKHKYGDEAGDMARHLTSGVKNVGLVYIDATGVSRRAVVKSVAKGMVVGKFKTGGELIVGDQPLIEGKHGMGDHASVLNAPLSGTAGPSHAGASSTAAPVPQYTEGEFPPPPAYEAPRRGTDSSLYDMPEKSRNTYQ
jgi:spartin